MSSENLKTFFGDLRAAVLAGVKMEIGDGDSPAKALTTKRLDQLEQSVANGESLPQRYEAAMETWQKTGSMIPVLEGLSTRVIASNRIGRLFRKSLIYVLAIGMLAIAALVWYQLYVLPEIDAVRQDLIEFARSSQQISPSYVEIWSKAVLLLFAVLLFGMITWLSRGGIARAGWWLGADGYIRYRTLATASRTTQALVAAGEEPESAASLSGRLAGLESDNKGELFASIRNLNRNAILSSEWSDYLLMMAQQQYVTARIWGPATLIVAIGGIFTLLFVVLAYWPITSLIFDLSHNTQL